jgi:hypothetical protein
MTPGSKIDYRANSITAIILSAAWIASTSDDRRRYLPSFLLPARIGHQGSILWLHLWQRRASLSRLVVATQQVWENHDMGALGKEGWLWFDLKKAVVASNAQKLLLLNAKALLLEMWHRTYHRVHCGSSTEETRLTNSQHLNHTNPGYSNRVRVHAAHDHEHDCRDNFTLYRGCTHSPWVAIILGSQAPVDPMEYLYTLLRCAPGHHYKAFQRFNLVCSTPAEVSLEVSD